ncbi:MAG: cation transporter [Clostridiales bacterium]|nr:cation transporter [Clostridiales bacterium]
MITLLSKFFIKQKPDTPEGRRSYGTLCGLVGIFLNLILFAGKYIAGMLSHSVAITADAFNNISDAGSSAITLIGFRLAGKKPDTEHPFGHGRIEYISGVGVSVIIIAVGLSLAKESIQKIISPEAIEASYLAMAILVVSILIKGYMFLYNHAIAKKIVSQAMNATARDSINDAVATTVVLISMLIARFSGYNIDGYCGIAVSLFILYSGIQSVKETVAPLLGGPPDKELVENIEKIVLSHHTVKGMHDLVIHDYGPGRLMVSLHAEVDGSGNIFALHDEIDCIEKELNEQFHCHSVIHMDPVVTDDDKITSMRKRVAKEMKAISPDVSIHDFRMVEGPSHTNVIFDIVVPHEIKLSEEEIRQKINLIMREKFENTFPIVEVDRPYL